MSLEVLYVAKNRFEFTKASFNCLVQNTNWSLVSKLVVYDDGSIDDTADWLISRLRESAIPHELRFSNLGGPASIMIDYIQKSDADLFVKIDNDVMVPPGWLDVCVDQMNFNNHLDLLGIEPYFSRTPHFQGGQISPQPELFTRLLSDDPVYAPCDSIGGIGLMRRRVFVKYPDLKMHSIYGGFTEWQLRHRDIIKGWMVPPLKVFLLDRMPIEPWRSLSIEYIAKGWQRPWTNYPLDNTFWDWYTK